MNDHKEREKVQLALDTTLSRLKDDPWLAQKVLASSEGEVIVKKKISIGFVLVMILILAAVTALAAVLLSTQELVEQTVVPMAQENDSKQTNDMFSNAELSNLFQLAKENEIVLSNDMLTALQGGYGFSEQEAIMGLAKREFGPVYAQWTLEQQHWFGEMMVAIGYQTVNNACLPDSGELSFEQALSTVQARIEKHYGDDISDEAVWTRGATYESTVDDKGNITPASWLFEFQPLDAIHNEYRLTMNSDGTITSFVANKAPDSSSTVEEIARQHKTAFGGYNEWSPETWAAFGKAIDGRKAETKVGLMFQRAAYQLPPQNGVTIEQVKKAALEAIDLEYTTVEGAACCMDGDTPIWKIELHTLRPEDVGSGNYSAIWLVELDCMTGTIREKREFVVGNGTDPLTRWIPWSVFGDASIN